VTVLFLLTRGPDPLSRRIIQAQEREHQVTVVDLSSPEVSYDRVIDEIAAHDRVISW
jgi:hypothetical protein